MAGSLACPATHVLLYAGGEHAQVRDLQWNPSCHSWSVCINAGQATSFIMGTSFAIDGSTRSS